MSAEKCDHLDSLHDGSMCTDASGEPLRKALASLERDNVTQVPSATQMLDRVRSNPSPLDAPVWSFNHGLRLMWLVARMQVKLSMGVILITAMMVMGISVVVARSLVVGGFAEALNRVFAGILLAGTAICMAFSFADASDRELMLSVPLGPSTQVAVRMTMTLSLDVVANLVATWLAVTFGSSQSMGILIAGWLMPLLLVCGICALVSLWFNPWVGLIAGLLVTYVVIPKSTQPVRFLPDAMPSLGDLASTSPIGSVAMVTAGLVSVLIAIGGARLAYTSRLSI